MFDDITPPLLTFLARIEVDIATPVDLGMVAGTPRRIVPIQGGTVTGPDLTGKVLAGGADFQILPRGRPQDLEARYAIETDDGARIYVENRGMRSGSPADLARLSDGEHVESSLIYFRSSPRLHAPEGRWDWINSRIFVAKGERMPDLVRLDLFVVG